MFGRLFPILLGPDAVDSSGGTPAPAESAPDSTAGLDRATLDARPEFGSASPSAGAETGVPAPEAAPTASAAPGDAAAPTIRDAARYYGLDLSAYDDDAQAFAHLVQRAQAASQNDYYAQLGRTVAPHYKQVQQYIEQQRQAQPAENAQRRPWEAPEFDERWLNYVERDPNTGIFKTRDGVPPWIAEKVQAYAEHIDNWTSQLTRDPRRALDGLVREIAGSLIEERFGQHQASTQAQQIVQENQEWIYAKDAQGRRLVAADGRYVPTPLGARYYTHLQTLRAAGVNDARMLDGFAKQLLRGEFQTQAASGPAAPPPARPNVNPGQAVEPTRRGIVPAAVEPNQAGLSLSEMLRQAMAEEGVSDADFQDLA